MRAGLDHIHIGLVHQLQKLAGVGGQALHIAALPFRIQRVKRQAGLARTTQARDHHQLVARNVQIDVFQVVRARTPDADGLLLQGPGQVGAVRVIGRVGAVGRWFQGDCRLRETHHDSERRLGASVARRATRGAWWRRRRTSRITSSPACQCDLPLARPARSTA